ncbi:MAG: hypothetical protein Q4E99_05935 [Bacillota bacterium]|nr:hypothetical protein [Bacillota bacterium]
MQKLTWWEVHNKMTEFNEKHGYKSKGTEKKLVARVVITEDSFDKPYTLDERTYEFTSDNKAFLDMISNSIFANCIDGKDIGVRLDYYIPDSWKVEYCYLMNEEE